MDARVSKGIFLVLWAVPPLRLRARSAKKQKKAPSMMPGAEELVEIILSKFFQEVQSRRIVLLEKRVTH